MNNYGSALVVVCANVSVVDKRSSRKRVEIQITYGIRGFSRVQDNALFFFPRVFRARLLATLEARLAVCFPFRISIGKEIDLVCRVAFR